MCTCVSGLRASSDHRERWFTDTDMVCVQRFPLREMPAVTSLFWPGPNLAELYLYILYVELQLDDNSDEPVSIWRFRETGEKCQNVFNADEHQAVPNKPLTAEKVEEKEKKKLLF